MNLRIETSILELKVTKSASANWLQGRLNKLNLIRFFDIEFRVFLQPEVHNRRNQRCRTQQRRQQKVVATTHKWTGGQTASPVILADGHHCSHDPNANGSGKLLQHAE